MKRILMVLAVALVLATPAFANTCPALMTAIDAALATNPNLSPEKAAEVEKLREEGEDLHDAGNHAQSEEALRQAMAILGIK